MASTSARKGKAANRDGPAGERATPGHAVDWDDVARLLAAGHSHREVCELAGCTLPQLQAKLARSAAFREAVERHREQGPGEPAVMYDRLRRLVYTHLERLVRSGNLRVLLWIADKLKLVQPLDKAAPELELQSVLENLSDEELARFEALGHK
ncbi:MAG TPA: hypothetical protein ENJ38_01190 [Rhodospirillales bacterium]|nr:hypothetical protein [Rhodospirillales bacterium]